MNNKDLIQKSINFYTTSSSDCEIMKILMSPIELLSHINDSNKINTKNQANTNLCNFILSLTHDDQFIDEFNHNVSLDQRSQPFIKTDSDLYYYLKHIQNILLQSYLNYHDPSKKIPSKLYRSVSLGELEYLKSSPQIDTLWSTTSMRDCATWYTLDVAEHEWNPKEHFIIELSTQNKIPFVNVDVDATRSYEPGEFILTPPFNVSKLKLIRKGGMDALGFYNEFTIPIYSAEIKTNYNYQNSHQVSYEEIYSQFMLLKKDINKYGNMIEAYLNNASSSKNLLHNPDYIVWARNLIQLIQMLQQYINEYAKEALTCSDELPKRKILK